ncbi:MAG: Hpt domain-containing protein [Burkholderiaceae bacterium]
MGRAAPTLPVPGAVIDEAQALNSGTVAPTGSETPVVDEPVANPVVQPEVLSAPENDAAAEDDEDEDLRAIFLEEAREVVVNGNEAVRQLRANPDDLAQLTTLRRAFHTLKGSSRMVGLSTFGEAAWAMEQLFNAVLAEQRPATDELLDLAHQSLAAFARWADSIESKSDQAWQAQPFIDSAQALREQTGVVPLAVPGAEDVEPLPDWEESAEAEPEPVAYVAPDPTIEAELEGEGGNEGENWAVSDFVATSPAALTGNLPESEKSLDAGPETSGESSGLMSDIDFNLVAPSSGTDTDAVGADAPPSPELPDLPIEVTTEDATASAPDLPSMFDGLTLDFDDLPAVEPSQETSAGQAPDVESPPQSEGLFEAEVQQVADGNSRLIEVELGEDAALPLSDELPVIPEVPAEPEERAPEPEAAALAASDDGGDAPAPTVAADDAQTQEGKEGASPGRQKIRCRTSKPA